MTLPTTITAVFFISPYLITQKSSQLEKYWVSGGGEAAFAAAPTMLCLYIEP